MPHLQVLSSRAISLQPSLTLAITSRAKVLRDEGRDICSLSAGEPDFDTPNFIVEAAQKALQDGITKYGPASGDPILRAAIAEKLTQTNNIPTTTNNVLVTNGGKQAIYNLFQVILNPGDEVIIPSPYWLSYPEIVSLAGATPVTITSNPDDGFLLDIEALEKSINLKTKLIVLNSPGNPTGRIISNNEMSLIAEIMRKYSNLLLMSDEIYEFLLADGEKHESFASIAPDLKDRVFTVNGFAKSWAMTGWRVGYLAGREDVIKAAAALQSQTTSNVCSFAQRGALAAIQGSKECVLQMANIYNNRRETLTKGLMQIEGIKLVPPQGAFYAFPKLPTNFGGSIAFCERALEEVGLAMVPGKPFGNDQCIRLSCAASNETIAEGLKRLKNFMAKF